MQPGIGRWRRGCAGRHGKIASGWKAEKEAVHKDGLLTMQVIATTAGRADEGRPGGRRKPPGPASTTGTG